MRSAMPQRRFRPHPVLALLIALWMLSWHSSASALCAWGDMPGPSHYRGTANPISVNMAYHHTGDRLSDIGGIPGTNSWKIHCAGSERAGYFNLVGNQLPAIGNSEKGAIYPIAAIPGLGYSLSDTNLYHGPQASYFNPYGAMSAPRGDFFFDSNSKLRVDFWKIGDTRAGSYCLSAGTQLGYVKFSNLVVLEVTLARQLCLNIQQPTCAVSTESKNITVNLGNHLQSQFTRRDMTTSSRPFSISLNNCSYVQAVDIQFIGNPDPDATNAALNGIVQLDHAGGVTATGVAVQLLNDHDNPLKLNQPQTVWQHVDDHVNIPFAVRYIQTKPRVTPGQANASVQFLMSYR